jgi:hypothetical protein
LSEELRASKRIGKKEISVKKGVSVMKGLFAMVVLASAIASPGPENR